MYLKLKYGDFLLIDIVYENGPIKFLTLFLGFCSILQFLLVNLISISDNLKAKKVLNNPKKA